MSNTSFLSSASLCVGFILREASFVCMKDDQRVPGQCHPQSWQSSREKERLFPNSSRNKILRKTPDFLAWLIAPFLNQSPKQSALARTGHLPPSMVRVRSDSTKPYEEGLHRKGEFNDPHEVRKTCLARKYVATTFS